MRFEGRHATVAVLLLLFPLLAGYALAIRAPCDDAYIFATYARNLLDGNGLTFNGDRVEGFTSTLCVVLAIVPGWLGVPLPLALDIASLLSAGAALLATYSLGRAVGLSPPRALLAPCLVTATGDRAFYASTPERLYREHGFALYLAIVVLVIGIALVFDLPPLHWFLRNAFTDGH